MVREENKHWKGILLFNFIPVAVSAEIQYSLFRDSLGYIHLCSDAWHTHIGGIGLDLGAALATQSVYNKYLLNIGICILVYVALQFVNENGVHSNLEQTDQNKILLQYKILLSYLHEICCLVYFCKGVIHL